MFRFGLFLLLLLSSQVFGDTIVLKNGQKFENVKSEIQSDFVVFEWNGTKKSFPKKQLASLKLRPVLLNDPGTAPTKPTKKPISASDELAKERIRMAESFLGQFDWESEIGGKPTVAFLPLEAGEGVSSGEIETINQIFSTTLVQTNLFSIIDPQSLKKIKSEQEKFNPDCKTNRKDCNMLLGSLLNAQRLITGKVTKVGNILYLNAMVVDPSEKRIEFAESEVIERSKDIASGSELFSKKIAGGILEYYDVSYYSKSNIPNLIYLKQSAYFPGFGQINFGKEKEQNFAFYRGLTFGVISSILMFKAYTDYQSFQNEKDNYRESKDILLLSNTRSLDLISLWNEQRSLQRLEGSAAESRESVSLLGLVYLFSLVDTYYLPSLPNVLPKASMHFQMKPQTNVYGQKMNESVYSLELRYLF
ncbi:hypothetical protein LPTSP4_19830 [Leptospira ryugenii]|uniref:DUF5683 domain-containing protein n=1 Tax=Leptospira ryugenii TaxID=1917863 RepID=A0A2P2E0P5_9LEPT|nr:hypothetical protein [Leptospira ryugenii]GBF50458.1 hypothetical protein LPTSP4_19830 [Leptospira ryugenii]